MANALPRKPEHVPPDSSAPYGPCPRCQRASNFKVVGTAPVSYTDQYIASPGGGTGQRLHDEQMAILQCQGCTQNTVVIEEQYVGGRRARDGGRSGAVEWRGIHWWPTPGARTDDPDVPSAVASSVAEAERCRSVNSPRAAAVMFRGALAEIVTAKGSVAARDKRSLAAQLKQMAADGALDANLADWADHVRVLGNAGAHPNELEPVTSEEADDLSRLVHALIDYLFIHPARVQRARLGR